MSFLDPILSSGPADSLLTNVPGAPVNVSQANPPNPGDVLIAQDAEHAVWQTPTAATAAGALDTTGAPVDVSASAPPNPGDVLTAIDAEHAAWLPTGTLATVPPSEISIVPADPGVSTEAARADHVHSVSVAAPADLVIGGTGEAGTSPALSASDHVHGLPPFGSGEGEIAAGDDPRFALRYVDLEVEPLDANTWGVTHVDTDEGYYDSGLPAGLPDGTRVGFMIGLDSSHGGFDLPESMQQRDGSFGSGCPLSLGQYAEWTLIGGLWYMTGVTLGMRPDLPDPAELYADGTGGGSIGDSLVPARSDHSHNVQVSVPSALTVGGVQALGTARYLCRSDHIHAMPGLATGAASGFMSAAQFTKLGGIATGAAALTSTAPTTVSVATATAGVSTEAARQDHTHAVAWAAPSALAIGSAQNGGTSTSLARADHVHAMPAAGTPVALTVSGSNAPGSAATFARSDHVHQNPALASTVGDGFMSTTDKRLLAAITASGYGYAVAGVNGFRLSGSSTVPINPDGLYSTIYLTPYTSGLIALWVTSASGFVAVDGMYLMYSATAPSLALSGMSGGVPVDIFAAATAGNAFALEAVNWTNATTRATAVIAHALAGWVKSGDPMRRYLGTLLPQNATQITQSQVGSGSAPATCPIYNAYNRVPLTFSWAPSDASQVVASASTWQPYGNNTAYKINYVVGLQGDSYRCAMLAAVDTKLAASSCAVGVDSTSAPTGSRGFANATSGNIIPVQARAAVNPAPGTHYFAPLVYSASATAVFYGNTSPGLTGLSTDISC